MCIEATSLQKATAILEQAYEQERIYDNEYNSLSYFVRQIIETLHLQFSGHQLEDVQAFVARYRAYIIHHVQAELKNTQHNPFIDSLRRYGHVRCIKHEFLAAHAAELLHAVDISLENEPTSCIEVSAWRDGRFVVENEALPLPVTTEEQLLLIVNNLHAYTHQFELLHEHGDTYSLYYRFETTNTRILYAFLNTLHDTLLTFFALPTSPHEAITALQVAQWQSVSLDER